MLEPIYSKWRWWDRWLPSPTDARRVFVSLADCPFHDVWRAYERRDPGAVIKLRRYMMDRLLR